MQSGEYSVHDGERRTVAERVEAIMPRLKEVLTVRSGPAMELGFNKSWENWGDFKKGWDNR